MCNPQANWHVKRELKAMLSSEKMQHMYRYSIYHQNLHSKYHFMDSYTSAGALMHICTKIHAYIVQHHHLPPAHFDFSKNFVFYRLFNGSTHFYFPVVYTFKNNNGYFFSYCYSNLRNSCCFFSKMFYCCTFITSNKNIEI